MVKANQPASKLSRPISVAARSICSLLSRWNCKSCLMLLLGWAEMVSMTMMKSPLRPMAGLCYTNFFGVYRHCLKSMAATGSLSEDLKKEFREWNRAVIVQLGLYVPVAVMNSSALVRRKFYQYSTWQVEKESRSYELLKGYSIYIACNLKQRSVGPLFSEII
mmetsp:Transcript_38958/g.70179  ORF Transcript_38958/g.70179 Transcript_38958/m.70179 type:complete len:163 (+) Transcript_38958:370-858(+)